jgi:lipopolysaccharide export system protein LptC
LSQSEAVNEILRMRTSPVRTSPGRGDAPVSALPRGRGGIGLENSDEVLAFMDFKTPDVAVADGNPRQSGSHHLGAAGFDMTPVTSRGGFRAANLHSGRVRVLRLVAIVGSLLAISAVSAAVLLNPLRHLPGDISIGRVGVDGTKITADSPKITGAQKNGRPFEITARTGLQDTTTPDIIELLGVDSTLGAADASTTWVSAARGIYDSLHDKMTLEGDVRIKSSTGYELQLKTARIDFKTGGLVSGDPVKVNLNGGTITAKQLDVSDNGHKVSFDGEVTSLIDAGPGNPEADGASTESDR